MVRFSSNPQQLRSGSVQQSDDGVDVGAAEARPPQVLQETRFVACGVTRHRQTERQQEVVGGPEAPPH